MKIQLPKKALVAGGAGFLGTHLCERLLADGYEVTCLDNLYTGSIRNIQHLLWEPRIPLVDGLAKTIEYFRGLCMKCFDKPILVVRARPPGPLRPRH